MTRKTSGEKNLDYYFLQQKIAKEQKNTVYNQKFYNKRISEEDKKIIESNFAFKKKPMPQKIKLLFIILIILFLWFGYFSYQNEDFLTPVLFIIIFFFMGVAVHYDTNSKFYIFLFILIVSVLLIVSGVITKIINFGVEKLIKTNEKINNKVNTKTK